MEKEVVRYNNCFVCGPDNQSGLNLKFVSDGEKTRTELVPKKHLEGYKGILHGGIIATILDEVMIKAALAKEKLCVTAAMEIRYKSPASLLGTYKFEGTITAIRGRIIETEGVMLDESEKIIAEAKGKYMLVSEGMRSVLSQSLEK